VVALVHEKLLRVWLFKIGDIHFHFVFGHISRAEAADEYVQVMLMPSYKAHSVLSE